jgi:hypothetical protein
MTGRAPPFEDKYIPEPMSGCWLWLGSCDDKGYGKGIHGKRRYKAHRQSWIIHRGEIPPGLCVLHKCDVPSCINPDHLWLGTKADNTADMVRKKRNRGWGDGVQPILNGRNHPLAKLTEADALFIRDDTRRASVIAKDYGVSRQIVWKIKTHQNWAHI